MLLRFLKVILKLKQIFMNQSHYSGDFSIIWSTNFQKSIYCILYSIIYIDLRIKVQWKPRSVITLGQTISDYSNQLITLTEDSLLFKWLDKGKWGFGILIKIDHINQIIKLTVMTLKGFHCTKIQLFKSTNIRHLNFHCS